jgi:hypothetical protein
MKIRYWQEFSFSSQNPIFSVFALTFWAMTVAARVVTNADVSTFVTRINVSAQLGSSALFYGIKRS